MCVCVCEREGGKRRRGMGMCERGCVYAYVCVSARVSVNIYEKTIDKKNREEVRNDMQTNKQTNKLAHSHTNTHTIKVMQYNE